jgi:biotin operon repressor
MARIENPLEKMIDKSLEELKANSKAVEKAIEKLWKEEGIDVSEQEYMEIKQLIDTSNELDSILLKLTESQPKKKTKSKKRKAKRRK